MNRQEGPTTNRPNGAFGSNVIAQLYVQPSALESNEWVAVTVIGRLGLTPCITMVRPGTHSATTDSIFVGTPTPAHPDLHSDALSHRQLVGPVLDHRGIDDRSGGRVRQEVEGVRGRYVKIDRLGIRRASATREVCLTPMRASFARPVRSCRPERLSPKCRSWALDNARPVTRWRGEGSCRIAAQVAWST